MALCRTTLLVVALLVGGMGTAVAQEDCYDYAGTGWWPSALAALPADVADLVTTGDGRLLSATDIGVFVHDLTDPLVPVLAGFLPSASPIREVAVSGVTIAALTENDQLLVGVLGAPDQNRWVGSLPLPNASRLAVGDGIVAFRQSFDQLATVDVTDPKTPRYLGFLQLSEPFHEVEIAEGLALLATQFSLLAVCSLADPARPELIALAETFATGTALAVEFPRVHVGNIAQVISFDLSTPTAPVKLSTTPRMPGTIERMTAGRDHVFAVTEEGQVHHLATAGEPGTLRIVGHTYGSIVPRAAAQVGDNLYLVRAPREFEIFEAGTGVHPPFRSERLDQVPAVVAAAGDGFFALDTDHPDGGRLTISRIEPTLELTDLGFLPVFGNAVAMDIEGDRLALSTSQTDLALVDISDRTSPQYISLNSDAFSVRDVALLGNLVATIGRDELGGDTLVLYDRSNEPNVILAGAIRVPFGASEVIRWREFALVRTEFEMNGIMLIDCTVPSEPAITDWLAIEDRSVDVVVRGNHAYVLTEVGDLKIVDLSDPSDMTLVATLPLEADKGSISLVGTTLLVRNPQRGVTFVDVTNPGAATVTGSAWLPVTGEIIGCACSMVLNDVVYRQRTFLPAICDWISAVGDLPLAPGNTQLSASPNPFNPLTEIMVDLPAAAPFDLAVFDLRGRRVRTLAIGRPGPAGLSAVAWDGRDDQGRAVGAGVYLARLQTRDATASTKLVLVR